MIFASFSTEKRQGLHLTIRLCRKIFFKKLIASIAHSLGSMCMLRKQIPYQCCIKNTVAFLNNHWAQSGYLSLSLSLASLLLVLGRLGAETNL